MRYPMSVWLIQGFMLNDPEMTIALELEIDSPIYAAVAREKCEDGPLYDARKHVHLPICLN